MKIQELNKKIEELIENEDLKSLRELKYCLDEKMFSLKDKIRILKYRENIKKEK